MVGEYSIGLLIVLALVLAAEFINGWTDAPNAIATVVSTGVLWPATAVRMAAVFNFLGAMSGTAVAAALGLASQFGIPLSASIIGVGSARRFSAVRCGGSHNRLWQRGC